MCLFFHIKFLINFTKVLRFLKIITWISLCWKLKFLESKKVLETALRKTSKRVGLNNKGNWREMLIRLSLQLMALPPLTQLPYSISILILMLGNIAVSSSNLFMLLHFYLWVIGLFWQGSHYLSLGWASSILHGTYRKTPVNTVKLLAGNVMIAGMH